MEALPPKSLADVLMGFYDVNWQVVESRAAVALAANQEAAIHELRVATKKLRALYRLAEALAPGTFVPKAELKELRRLFKAGGPIRELHVHGEVLTAYEDLHVAMYRKVAKRLETEVIALRPSYNQARKAFGGSRRQRTRAKLEAVLKGMDDAALEAAVQAYIRERLRLIRVTAPAGYDPERIHSCRILLKEAMYLIALLAAVGRAGEFAGPFLQEAKDAAELAGQWHDREVMDQWLQAIARQGRLATSEHQYAFLLQDLNAHTRSMARKFLDAQHQLLRLVQVGE